MDKHGRIESFIEQLGKQNVVGAEVFNPYHMDNREHLSVRTNLRRYLTEMAERNPRTLLVGEAPGRKGCAKSGIPFTSLDMLCRTNKFGMFGDGGYEYGSRQKEATSTMVWRVLEELDLCPLLWNAYPFNPFKINSGKQKNRRPKPQEVKVGLDFLKQLRDLFTSVEQVIAVGGVAAGLLHEMNIDHKCVPHPSYGKKAVFKSELQRLLDSGTIGP